MEKLDKIAYVLALCLECGWREEGSSSDGSDVRVAAYVHKHVDREGHVVEVVRTEIRLHAPGG